MSEKNKTINIAGQMVETFKAERPPERTETLVGLVFVRHPGEHAGGWARLKLVCAAHHSVCSNRSFLRDNEEQSRACHDSEANGCIEDCHPPVREPVLQTPAGAARKVPALRCFDGMEASRYVLYIWNTKICPLKFLFSCIFFFSSILRLSTQQLPRSDSTNLAQILSRCHVRRKNDPTRRCLRGKHS